MSSQKRSVVIMLDQGVVEQILLIKDEYKKNGEYFSVSSVCEKALVQRVFSENIEMDSPAGTQFIL